MGCGGSTSAEKTTKVAQPTTILPARGDLENLEVRGKAKLMKI